MKEKAVPFEMLKNKTLTKIEGLYYGSDKVDFYCEEGIHYCLYDLNSGTGNDVHISVEDVCGDVEDLIGTPILLAEKNSNVELDGKCYDYSYTWTFYKLATINGYVDFRLYGSSNGYYSEECVFVQIIETNN